ncbi:MAG: MerR family transcriptional regulator [Planctomycetota bacterium]|nr:MerR family transcriptional regulator [Planctomycetota bacterium]
MTTPETREHYSIGDIAEETGITPETLRVWERRYGAPVPTRMPSGHRRYSGDQLIWLRDVAEALARGLRPGRVLRMPPEMLRATLGELAGPETSPADHEDVFALLEAFDGDALRTHLLETARKTSALEFLENDLAPLVASVGRGWAEGRLSVRHEHFFTATTSDVLRSLVAQQERDRKTPRIVLSTLEGEWHGLGLQMAMLIAGAHGLAPYVLGVSTPDEDLVRTAVDIEADVLGVSVSLATGGIDTDRRLAALRTALPDTVELVVGGEGARRGRRGPRGIRYVAGLGEWNAYLEALTSER